MSMACIHPPTEPFAPHPIQQIPYLFQIRSNLAVLAGAVFNQKNSLVGGFGNNPTNLGSQLLPHCPIPPPLMATNMNHYSAKTASTANLHIGYQSISGFLNQSRIVRRQINQISRVDKLRPNPLPLLSRQHSFIIHLVRVCPFPHPRAARKNLHCVGPDCPRPPRRQSPPPCSRYMCTNQHNNLKLLISNQFH